MKSNMQHSFSNTPSISAPRSKFYRPFTHKFTMDGGYLVPFMHDAVLPGDTFNVNTTIFARLATPLFPLMDNTFIDTHFFFVPYRLVWDNFRKFCGEQANPTDSIDFQIPQLSGTFSSNPDADLTTAQGRKEATLNYMGVPPGISGNDVGISALHFRAVAFCYNEWFRDQNFINSLNIPTGDGPDNVDVLDYFDLRRRGKRHDYFTSALPWPQKGDAVTLPLGTQAPISGIGTASNAFPNSGPFTETDGSTPTYTNAVLFPGATQMAVKGSAATGGIPQIYADLTQATASTVNDLREAFQVQKLLERDARGGTRYAEIVRNHFGVDFYDVSYRPEYLGGSSTPLNITPVAQSAPVAFTAPITNLGDLGAFATAGMGGHGFTKSFVEHGVVIGFISARADLTYQQGLNRHFSHSTRYDFYWPSLSHLGEQEILSKEIFCDGTAGDEDVFGYQERYAEYRYKPSQISGKFQSASAASLDPWHLSQEFSTRPTLGQTFISEDPPFDRVITTPSEPHFIVDTFTEMVCARPMPVFGVPGLIDHF